MKIYRQKNNLGFSLVEILVVVGIIALLAAISGPVVIQHRRRAIAMEPHGMMALIKEAQKDYWIVSGSYYDVMATVTTAGNIQNALPTSVSSGVPTPSTAGVDVDAGVTQYFSNRAYSVDATSPSSARFTAPSVVDFLVQVNGANSTACTTVITTNCAINAGVVSTYRLEMDNSGRAFVSYDSGTNWQSL